MEVNVKNTNNVISKVYKDSIADELGIEVGDLLISINGEPIHDIIEYRFLLSDEYLEVETSDFLKRYSGHSMGGLVKTLVSSNSLSDNELDELRSLLDQNK